VELEARFVEDATAVNGIVQSVQTVGADLIVIGSHGRSGMARLVLGSVAAKVVARKPRACAGGTLSPTRLRALEKGRRASSYSVHATPLTGDLWPLLRFVSPHLRSWPASGVSALVGVAAQPPAGTTFSGGLAQALAQAGAPFARLPADLQLQLKKHIQVFVAEKAFIGCDGLRVTDEMRVVVAAHACLLLLNRTRASQRTTLPGFVKSCCTRRRFW